MNPLMPLPRCLCRLLMLLPLLCLTPGTRVTAQTTDTLRPFAGTTTATTATAPNTTEIVTSSSRLVCVIPVDGEFENALHLILVRALRQATREGADLIVLDMNTPGGRVDSAIKIRDLLIRSEIPTLTYVNPMAVSAGSFIAMATDRIVMGPNSSIGGALPIRMRSGGEAEAADRKFQSVFAAEMRKTAKTKNHPPEIAEGFCNPELVIPGLKNAGDILTLDYDQATSVGLAAYQATSLEDVLEREGLAGATVERFHLTRTDQAARFLSSSVVLGLLMMLGLSGILIELKAPGFGLPGVIGISAMALYFLGSYLANLSGLIEWVFFALGVILLAVEIYVLPGFGIAGLTGIALIAGSLFFALVNLAPDGGLSFGALRWTLLRGPALTLIAGLLGVIPFLYFLARLLPETGSMLGLQLPAQPPDGPARDGTATLTSEAPAAGDPGEALTDLRPTGTALINNRRTDVLTEGEYLPAGSALEVCRVEGGRVFVRPRQ